MKKYIKEWERELYVKELMKVQSGDEWNEIVTETAGFEPLEVKFKRMEQAGYRAQFQEADFTSSDLRQIYLNPDFDYGPEDELEDIQEKERSRAEYIAELIKKKQQFEQMSDEPIVKKAGTKKAKTDVVSEALEDDEEEK